MTPALNNEQLAAAPRTSFDGAALAFDLPGLRVGVAAELFASSGYSVEFEQIALVRRAIMDDFGGRASVGAVGDSAMDPVALGVLASALAWDAALRAVGVEPAGGPQG